MATAAGSLLVVGALVSGCASDSEREWEVAANPRATADEIIDAGHATGIATSEDQMVVTWEVQPEDDEGPYQGAWRLYGRGNVHVADGTFGTVREASARIDAVAVRDGFLLTDYVKYKRHFLARSGQLAPADWAAAKPGASLAGGVLAPDHQTDGEGWHVILPAKRQILRLADLPTRDVQGIQLTSDGTVWVLLPWGNKGPFKVAHAKDGRPPWTTETIPLSRDSGAYGDSLSASGNRLFVVAGRERGDSMAVDAILSREAGEKDWATIDASGIAVNLTTTPRIAVLPGGRLVAIADGEGAWIQREDGTGFSVLQPPRSHKESVPDVDVAGGWLWSSEPTFGNTLHYSRDLGRTWHEFDR